MDNLKSFTLRQISTFVSSDTVEEYLFELTKLCNTDFDYKNKIYLELQDILVRSSDVLLLRLCFLLIGQVDFKQCAQPLYNWLCSHYSYLIIDRVEKTCLFKDALSVFALIQFKKSSKLEFFWANIWKESTPFFWPVAFMGMSLQNPTYACKEVPLLIERAGIKSQKYLLALWQDEESRPILDTSLRKGLKNKDMWAKASIKLIADGLDYKTKEDFSEYYETSND